MNRKFRNLIVFLIVIEVFLYEWGIFELGVISTFAYLFKVGIPVFLISITYYNKRIKLHQYLIGYILVFILFAIVSLVSCLLSYEKGESIFQYIKIIPARLLFIVSLCGILYTFPDLIRSLNKVFFAIAVFTFFQYLLAMTYVQAHPFEQTQIIQESRGTNYAGPFGIFGNISTQFSFFDVQYLRLTGFWLEPSNAAGFMMSCFFLGKFIKGNMVANKFISIIYIFPLLGGILAISNAGYLSLAAGFFALVLLKGRYYIATMLKIMSFVLLIIVGLNGRELVYNFAPENNYLKLIVGLKSVDSSDIDYSDGRIDTYKNNFNRALETPWGIGFRIPGVDKSGAGDATVSASAFFYILAYTGFLGLATIILMKLIVIRSVIRIRLNNNALPKDLMFLFCAWVCVAVQNFIYGNWMGFYYYYLAIASIVLFIHSRNKRDVNKETSPEDIS